MLTIPRKQNKTKQNEYRKYEVLARKVIG